MSIAPKNDPEPAKSLGLVELPKGAIDTDFAISERYQSFSGELLRLALLGIAGIGFLLVQLDPGTKEAPSLIRQNLQSMARRRKSATYSQRKKSATQHLKKIPRRRLGFPDIVCSFVSV